MSFFDLQAAPAIQIQTDDGFYAPARLPDVSIDLIREDRSTLVHLAAPNTAVRRVFLRWRGVLDPHARILGDHWERAYGDLEWRGVVPDRVMPWYTLVHEQGLTHGYGVATQPNAFCWWRVDQKGITLCLDVRNGAMGVRLGARPLDVARIITRPGVSGESSFQSAAAFCKRLCPNPRLPNHVVYGSNNWYYAYGESTPAEILRDTDILAVHAPGGPNRPYMVIDAGWQARAASVPAWDRCCGGPWDRGNADFFDMPELARQIRSRGARPGVWIRPLGAIPGTHASRLLPVARAQDNSAKVDVYDPSIEENLHQVESDFRTASQWGYELIKHDWTSCDVLGRWGFNMGHELTSDGWQFSDRSKTSAEIVLDLFRAIRRGAGASVVIGCNTFSHLSAGIFEIQRTGDDTSGREWERTRKMGPNTLAFRMPQHDAFYAVDADCVGLTDLVPWELNRQWLEVLSTSGTPLFVSTDPKAVTPERSAALKEAFAIAAQRQPISVPLDWMQTTCPHDWQVKDRTLQFDWNPAEPAL